MEIINIKNDIQSQMNISNGTAQVVYPIEEKEEVHEQSEEQGKEAAEAVGEAVGEAEKKGRKTKR